MGDGIKLAMAILVFFGAMLAFFFAFHPGGVEGVSDPATMLQWLMKEFETTSTEQTNTGTEATGTTQAPGTSTAGGRG